MALRHVFLAVLMICASGASSAQSIIFNTEEWYPYSHTDENGSLKGTAVDVVKAMIEKLDIKPVISVNSRTRSYNRALSRDGNCSFPSPMVGKHKIRFKWVSPIETNRWVVYKKRGYPFVAKNISGLEGQKIGGFIGSTVTSYIRSLGVDMILLARDEDGLQDLNTGKINLWATTEFAARTLSKKPTLKLKRFSKFVKIFLASPATKILAMKTITKMQEALDSVNASGMGDEIRQSKF